MDAVIARSQPRMAAAERRVTILGATGSIGASTIDVVAHEPARYRVEAVASGGNAAALARLARDHGARFAAIADPQAYRDLKSLLSGTGIEPAGRSGDGGDLRRERPRTDARGPRPGHDRGARQQGMPGLRRRFVHAHGG